MDGAAGCHLDHVRRGHRDYLRYVRFSPRLLFLCSVLKYTSVLPLVCSTILGFLTLKSTFIDLLNDSALLGLQNQVDLT